MRLAQVFVAPQRGGGPPILDVLSEAQAQEIEKLGRVGNLFKPNDLHNTVKSRRSTGIRMRVNECVWDKQV